MRFQKTQLINKCENLPSGAEWQVRRSLRWIDPNHLAGIGFIELIDKLPEVKKTSPDWHKESKASGRGINAWYLPETEIYSASIVLHMPELCYGIPRFLWWTTVPTLIITKVLAHEVAHHLKLTRGYIFARSENLRRAWQEEAAADRYAFDLIRRMRGNLLYWLGHEMIDVTAQTYYRLGVNRWKENNYAKAASYWKKAWKINSDHTYAAHWYRRALEMNSGEPSQEEEIRVGDGDSQ